MEFAPWRRSRRFVRMSSDFSLYEAPVGESGVRVVVTGMGPRAAKQAMIGAMRQGAAQQIHACMVCGLAGALREGFERGEIVAARQVREAESHRVVESDAGLLARAIKNGARPVTLCTASYVAGTPEAKGRMSPLGDVVDMESFVVMEQAAERGIPAVAVRAISDLANEEMPADLARLIDSRGAINYWRATAAALESPHRLPRLIRFGRQSGRAARDLARFLDRFVAGLPAAGTEF
jgi:adenosylhomocysteine nucleosidase